MRIEVVTIPYRYDEPDEGLGLGPTALLDAGVLSRIPEAARPAATPGPLTRHAPVRQVSA